MRGALDREIDEYMFGDDVEVDAFIYLLYSDLCVGRAIIDTLSDVLVQAGVYEDDLSCIVQLVGKLPRHDGGKRIFIHFDWVSAPKGFEAYGHWVCLFYNYVQSAFVLLGEGALGPLGVLRVVAELVIHHGFTVDAFAVSYMDVATRGYVGVAVAECLVEAFADV